MKLEGKQVKARVLPQCPATCFSAPICTYVDQTTNWSHKTCTRFQPSCLVDLWKSNLESSYNSELVVSMLCAVFLLCIHQLLFSYIIRPGYPSASRQSR